MQSVMIFRLKSQDIHHLYKVSHFSPGRVSGALSQYAQVSGSTPQSGHIQESTSEGVSKCNNKFISLFLSVGLSPSPPLSLKSINKFF